MAGVLAVLAACGGGDEPQPPAPTAPPAPAASGGLDAALRSVAAGPAATARFGWTDVARLREVAGFPGSIAQLRIGREQAAWQPALGAGGDRLLSSGAVVADTLKLDYLAAASAISIGEPPRVAVRLDGVDGAAVEQALRDLGAQEVPGDGLTFLARGEEGEIDPRDPARLLGLGNRAVVDGGTVALSGYEATAAEILGGGGTPLAGRREFAAAAECLGDVVSAQILPGRTARVRQADVVAVGIRAQDGPQEVLCAVGGQDDATGWERALRERLRPQGRTPDTGQPLGDLVAGVAVDGGEADGRAFARAVADTPEGRPADFLGQSLERGALAYYLGA